MAGKNKKLLLLANSILTMLFIGMLLIALAWLSNRYPLNIDMSGAQQHRLPTDTLMLLKNMPDPIDISSYATEDPALRGHIETFIARYKRSKPNLKLNFINPDNIPEQVRQLGVSVNGELLIRYKKSSAHVKKLNDEQVSRALERLLRNENNWLVFLSGHGERNPRGKANDDLGNWGKQLSQRGLHVQLLNLNEQSIPDNTAVLIIADPQVRLLANEIADISAYIARGGNLLWLAEPKPQQGLTELSNILGIDFKPGKIISATERQISINDPSIILMTKNLYPAHPITEGFQLTTLFPGVTVIQAHTATAWSVNPLLITDAHAWLESTPEQKPLRFDAGPDKKGPLPIALSLERQHQGRMQRIVVLGDGDFLSNTYLENSGNLEFGLRIINWLAQADSMINIPSSDKQDTELHVSSFLLGWLGIFFTYMLPVIFLLFGIYCWWRRRPRS